jgi:hypothetical protein
MQDGGNGKKIGTGENGRGRIWRLIYDELVEKDKEEVEEKIERVSLMAGQDSCTRYSEAKARVQEYTEAESAYVLLEKPIRLTSFYQTWFRSGMM